MVVGVVPEVVPWASQPAARWRSPLGALAAACAMGIAVTTGGSPDGTLAATVTAGTVTAGTVTAGTVTAPADACAAPAWVTGWQAAGQPAPGPDASTLRMLVHPQVTGSQIRIRLSNTFGKAPLLLGRVSAARSDGGAGLRGPVTPVTFGGRPGVLVPPGGQVHSDPVPVVAEVGVPLAVSMFLPVRPEVVTQHAVALQTSWLSRAGDATLAAGGAAFDVPVGSWMVLDGVEVLAPRPVNAVVAVGDSITDGVGSAPDTGGRWSDALSGRLTRTGGAAGMAVLNAGLSRNRLLSDDPADGDSPATRFDRDVTAATGVTDVVLHIGTNDIATGRTADEIVTGLARFADRTRAAGRRVFLTTITPSHTGSHGSPAAITVRDTVNTWVRVHGREHADGVFDFAAAVADPVVPSRLAPEFDSGDGLHLSAAGYRALAATVDGLTGSPCLADTSPARVVVAGAR